MATRRKSDRVQMVSGGQLVNGVFQPLSSQTDFEPKVSAQDLVSPPPAPKFTEPAQPSISPSTSSVVSNVTKEVDGIIRADTEEVQRLKLLREEQAGFGFNGAQMFDQRLEEQGVNKNMQELKDINLRLADMTTASELRKVRIAGGPGQTYNQGLREVNQEDREEAVRQAGLAARASVLTDNINTATALAKDAVNYAFQDASLELQNRRAQIEDLSGVVDEQTQQLLDAQLREIEKDEARVKEVKSAVQAAILAGASQSQIDTMLSSTVPEEERFALAQSIIGSNARTDISLDRRVKGAQATVAEMAIEKQRQIDEAIANGEVVLDPEQQKTAMSLGKQFEDESKGFKTQVDAYNRITAAAEEPSAAGDLALIFGYMKLLDPGSVVREQEFANAQNAAGVPERIRAQYNKLLKGERLSDSTRQDFMTKASGIYSSALEQQMDLEETFREQATSIYGLPVNAADLIIRDIRATGAVSEVAFGIQLDQLSDDQLMMLIDEGLMPVSTAARQ